jgi:hypothetical protein
MYKYDTYIYIYILATSIMIEKWNNSVGIATGYGLDDQGGREFESL